MITPYTYVYEELKDNNTHVWVVSEDDTDGIDICL